MAFSREPQDPWSPSCFEKSPPIYQHTCKTFEDAALVIVQFVGTNCIAEITLTPERESPEVTVLKEVSSAVWKACGEDGRSSSVTVQVFADAAAQWLTESTLRMLRAKSGYVTVWFNSSDKKMLVRYSNFTP